MRTTFGETALGTKEHLDRVDVYEWFEEMYDDRRYIDRAPGAIEPDRVARVIRRTARVKSPSPRYLVGPQAQALPARDFVPDRIYDSSLDQLQRFETP